MTTGGEDRVVPRVLDLVTVGLSRTAFLRAFGERLRSEGRSTTEAEEQMRLVNWFLKVFGRAPAEATQHDVTGFLAERVAAGADRAKLSALKAALEAAFDKMCGHVIAGPIALDDLLPVRESGASTAEPEARDSLLQAPQSSAPLTPVLRLVQPVTQPVSEDPTPSLNTSTPPSLTTRRRARRERLIRALSCEVGLRPREIAALRWTDVDLDAGLILLRAPAGNRRLLLTSHVRELLARALRKARDLGGHLFPSVRGPGPITARTVQRILRTTEDATRSREEQASSRSEASSTDASDRDE